MSGGPAAATPASARSTIVETSAADRIHRVFGRFIAAGFVCYLFFLVPSALEQAPLTAPWWTPTALVAVFGTGLALGVATFLPDVRWVSRFASANAVGYLLAVALWWPAWTGEAAMDSAWQGVCPGVAALSAAAAWRPRVALSYLVVVVVVVQSTNYALQRDTIGYLLVPELAFALMFCGVFAVAAMVAIRTGHVLDATIATTHDSIVAAAAARAKTVEREQFDALVHDQVMSTLLASGRGGSERQLAAQARRALVVFDSLRHGKQSEQRFGVEQVLAQFRSAASDVDEDVVFTADVTEGEGGVPQDFPSEPVRAVAAALAEAVRNSVRHAGIHARRTLHVDAGPGRLQVTVSDDGHGFDPGAVGAHRMGIRASIRGRMRQLPGGAATVSSVPGTGTVVTLSWTEPGSAEPVGAEQDRARTVGHGAS